MKISNHIKLFVFVSTTLVATIALFYLVINKSNLLGSSIVVRTQFSDIQGLQVGNNVRYGGMQVGIVKDIYMVNDSTIEVLMTIKSEMRKYIRKNAIVSISADGFVGDKLISITPSSNQSFLVEDNDQLSSLEPFDLNTLITSVNNSEADVTNMIANMNSILKKINESNEIWDLTSNSNLAEVVLQATNEFRRTGHDANIILASVKNAVADIRAGKGLVGAMVADSQYILRVDTILSNTSHLINKANNAVQSLTQTLDSVEHGFSNRKNIMNTILRDSAFKINIEQSVIAIEAGTRSFNDVMSALKESVFLRRAIRRQEKKRHFHKN
jgi:phospholipid/cholesterol/gamma-HCH transport system substrate-binding protein